MGVHGKIWFLGLVYKKKQYIGGFSKKGGLEQFADIREGLKKKWWCF